MPAIMTWTPTTKQMVCYKGTTLAALKAIWQAWQSQGGLESSLYYDTIAVIDAAISINLPACGYSGDYCGAVQCPFYSEIIHNFSENFESLQLGNISGQGSYTYFQPWSGVGIVILDNGNKILRQNDYCTANLSLKSGYQIKYGYIKFKARSSVSNRESSIQLFKDSTSKIYFKFGSNGKMSFTGADNFMDYSQDTYYEIRISFSFMTRRLYLYINQQFEGMTWLPSDDYNQYINSIQFQTSSGSVYNFDIDNIFGSFYIYQP